MFHYWCPKGAGFLGIGCLLVGGILDHQRNKYAEMKKKEIEARGGGMWVVDKDGNRKQIIG